MVDLGSDSRKTEIVHKTQRFDSLIVFPIKSQFPFLMIQIIII